MSVLEIERDEGFATLTLARPEAMNALSAELRRAIAVAFRELAEDPKIRVLVLTGSGRAFCAGLDLKELGSGEWGGGGAAVTEGHLIGAVRSFPGPVIAAVNGFAITGGFELALACDFIVASSRARFGDALAFEGRTSAEHMRGVSAEDISGRREAVQNHGRTQTTD